MSEAHRGSPRIEPPSPTTVAIEEIRGWVTAYGVLADVSKTGGCIWTDTLLGVGRRIHLRLSFAYPPEIHTLVATVVWASVARGPTKHACRCGVRWVGLGYTLRSRLRQMIRSAVPGPGKDLHLFETHWIVQEERPGPPGGMGSPTDQPRRPPPPSLSDTLPPVNGLRIPAARSDSSAPAAPRPAFPGTCTTCRLLHRGERDFRWPVDTCPRCKHLRYGQPGVCGCQPHHSDPKPLERMLLAEERARDLWTPREVTTLKGPLPAQSASGGQEGSSLPGSEDSADHSARSQRSRATRMPSSSGRRAAMNHSPS
jgi:hypothetical protein